jgi:hypothetical protein
VVPINAQGRNLKSFELEPPQRVISLSSASGLQKTIFIGRESPLGFNFYSKLPDSEKIYLMPEVMVLFLVADPKLFERASVPRALMPTRGVVKKWRRSFLIMFFISVVGISRTVTPGSRPYARARGTVTDDDLV